MENTSQVPVTVLTGFLGAGKTTLLNRILTEQHGRKYAVIVNEFGEQGIDNDLVVDADEEVFEMNNGCICCTVRGDLIRILSGLMKRADKLDAIIVETTGLADPAPVAQTFFVDQDVADRTKLDAIVTVADAVHLSSQLTEHHEAEEQIAFADVILLNKVDLVDESGLDRVKDRIKKINPFAKIINTTRCSAPLDEVVGLNAFSLDRILEVEPDFLESDHDQSIRVAGVPKEAEAGRWTSTLVSDQSIAGAQTEAEAGRRTHRARRRPRPRGRRAARTRSCRRAAPWRSRPCSS